MQVTNEIKVNIRMKIDTILIIDDVPKNIQVLANVLKENNYEVEYGTSGKEALEWVKKKKFDLILLDIMMPGMDGYTVCTKLKEDDINSKIPVIFITAKTDIKSISKAFSVGGVDYITKPFNEKELLARVETHLVLKKHKDNLENIIEDRTKQLQIAHKKLEALDEAKSAFLNLLSHEIRTPLNGILGSLQLLKLKSDDEDLQNLVNILDISAERLKQFSRSAELITRLKADRLNPDNRLFNLRKIIEFALVEFNDRILEKGIKIKIEGINETSEVLSDKDLLFEVIKRVIDNAINYSPESGKISIGAQKNNDRLILNISDEGPGFPEDFLKNELTVFQTGMPHINKNVGISLYLARLVMNNLEGELEFGNKESGGAFVDLYINDK